MQPFDYHRAYDLPDALAHLAKGAQVLAGGTNLVDLMKTGAARPDHLVDIRDIKALQAITPTPEGGLRLGAGVTNSACARDPQVLALYPVIAEAIRAGASAQVRNAATLGGNLLQAVRCSWYMDDTSPCGRRVAGQGCAAQAAREDAIFATDSLCKVVHPSDFCVALVALSAVVEVAGPDGTRLIQIEDFLRLPESQPHLQTDLRQGEIVTALILPPLARPSHQQRYVKLRERTSFAFALLSGAAVVGLDHDGRIAFAQVALGAVAARPWRVRAAEDRLIGHAPHPDLFATFAEAFLQKASVGPRNAFKVALARRLIPRLLQAALSAQPGHMPAWPGSVFDDSLAPEQKVHHG